MTPKLSPGDLAPNFTLKNQFDQEVSLNDFRGNRVIIYFYPKDFTPGCTQEACDFRDFVFSVDGPNKIIGISPDSVDKHRKFATEFSLDFDLLSDSDTTVMAQWGAYGEKQNYGKTVIGVIRSTFVIDPSGYITDALYGIKAKGHGARIAKLLGI